ncbi:ARM repeat-containing protein [Mycena pura]|uniref:MMS19 nucleotide excision repair protein n=1 Tax=Mycena pura TaxID=153505 RepID=A0AAD6YBS5_9AGAR|nr:ARM repeat-containing protein [Mycena pura]
MSSTSALATNSVEQLVTTWIVSGRDEDIAAAVTEVSEGRLLAVVKALGPYLTSEQDELRTKGVDFLATVIGRCPANTLSRQSVKVLAAFFCDKLDDTETIIPGLKGLLSLPSICSSVDAENVPSVFAHVRMRALVQSVRFSVFSIIDGLITHHRETLKGMKSEFIRPYINLAEGEKDPRNLLVAFGIARVILIEFDAGEHIEALSNILFCYFPITFRPPPNDPYGITSDDLRVVLRRCLSAHSGFGPIAIPIFLEKIAAGSPQIKRDTLQTMAECFPVYGPALARINARKLWNALKLEIFQPTDSLTEEEALSTVRVLVVTIHSEDAQDEDVQGLARDACEECIGILREPEKSQAKPAIKVLCTFMASTPSVARYTLANAVPHLLKLFADPREVPARTSVLLLLSDLIAAARNSSQMHITESMPETSSPLAAPPLAPFKDEVLGALISGVATLATARAALAGLTGLVSTPHLLSDAELGFIVLKVNEVLEKCYDEDHSDDSNAILKLLMTISSLSPMHVRDQTLPFLFKSLPLSPLPRDNLVARTRCQHVLTALGTLCGPPPLFAALVTEFSPRIVTIAFSPSDDDPELLAAFLHALLSVMKRVLVGKVDDSHDDVAGYIDTLVQALYGLCVRAALQGGPAREPRVIDVAGVIIGLVVQRLPLPFVLSCVLIALAHLLFPAFLSGKISLLCSDEHVTAEDRFATQTSSCIQAEATTHERNLFVLFEAGIVPLEPKASSLKHLASSTLICYSKVIIDVDINTCAECILVQGLAHADNARQAEAIFRIVGCIVNKHVENLGPFLEHKKTAYWSEEIMSRTATPGRRRQATRVWTWICKGLLVRNHPLALEFIHRLFDVFEDETIGTDAAKAFGDIAESDGVLTKRNSAVVKFLWAQKFATGILPRLMSGAKDDSNSVLQHANLVALTALIKVIPNTSYAHEMTQLMPLLMRALQIPDAEIRASVIETLLAAVTQQKSTHDVLAEHAPALVRQMLGYTKSSGAIRISALRYLSVLPAVVRYDVLHPCKADVLRELSEALDDPKRSVRREAVDAREVWFKYSG